MCVHLGKMDRSPDCDEVMLKYDARPESVEAETSKHAQKNASNNTKKIGRTGCMRLVLRGESDVIVAFFCTGYCAFYITVISKK